MTQQSQNKLSVILNILLLINKSGDNSLGGVLKRVLLVKMVEGTRWRAKIQVATSSNTSYVAGGNFPSFGVMISQASGIRASDSINDN